MTKASSIDFDRYFPSVAFNSSTINRCNATRITFSGYNTPFSIFILPSVNASLDLLRYSTPLELLPRQNKEGHFDWMVTQPVGTNLTLAITDDKAVWSLSDWRIVQNGTSLSCLPNDYDFTPPDRVTAGVVAYLLFIGLIAFIIVTWTVVIVCGCICKRSRHAERLGVGISELGERIKAVLIRAKALVLRQT